MNDKQLICDECGETYSYEDHKTVYDCLSADCDGSLVPDEDNQGQAEKTGGSGISVSYKISVTESPDGGLPVVNQNGELVGKVTDVDETEDGSFVADMGIDSDSAEWMIVSEGCDGGNSMNYPLHELASDEGLSKQPGLPERIKTATMCCGERMLVARVGQHNVKQMEVSFTCHECETDMVFYVQRDEAEVIEFAEKLKQSQDQQPTMSNMLWT